MAMLNNQMVQLFGNVVKFTSRWRYFWGNSTSLGLNPGWFFSWKVKVAMESYQSFGKHWKDIPKIRDTFQLPGVVYRVSGGSRTMIGSWVWVRLWLSRSLGGTGTSAGIVFSNLQIQHGSTTSLHACNVSIFQHQVWTDVFWMLLVV